LRRYAINFHELLLFVDGTKNGVVFDGHDMILLLKASMLMTTISPHSLLKKQAQRFRELSSIYQRNCCEGLIRVFTIIRL